MQPIDPGLVQNLGTLLSLDNSDPPRPAHHDSTSPGVAYGAIPFIACAPLWRIRKECETGPSFSVSKRLLRPLQWRNILHSRQATKECVNVTFRARALVVSLAALMPTSELHRAREECRITFHNGPSALSAIKSSWRVSAEWVSRRCNRMRMPCLFLYWARDCSCSFNFPKSGNQKSMNYVLEQAHRPWESDPNFLRNEYIPPGGIPFLPSATLANLPDTWQL